MNMLATCIGCCCRNSSNYCTCMYPCNAHASPQLDYHPDASDATPLDAQDFARAWMYTWATITCLPNFASDIRGRILLDLLNEPNKAGGVGLGWAG